MSKFGEAPITSEEVFNPETLPKEENKEAPQSAEQVRENESRKTELAKDAGNQKDSDAKKAEEILGKIKGIPDEKKSDGLNEKEKEKQQILSSIEATGKKSFFSKLKFWEKQKTSAELIEQARENFRELLNKNEFKKADDFIFNSEEKTGLTIDSAQKKDVIFESVLKEKAVNILRSGDGKNINKMVDSFGNDAIFNEDVLSALGVETLKNPEVKNGISEYVSGWINKFNLEGSNASFATEFKKMREMLSQKGILSVEEMNAFPEVKDKAQKEILNSAKRIFSKNNYSEDPYGSFEEVKRGWVDLGIFDMDEIESWPEVRKLAM